MLKKEEYWVGGIVDEVENEYVEIALRKEYRVNGKMARFSIDYN